MCGKWDGKFTPLFSILFKNSLWMCCVGQQWPPAAFALVVVNGNANGCGSGESSECFSLLWRTADYSEDEK